MSRSIKSFPDVLTASGPRPTWESPAADKNRYAMRFANASATLVANGLRKYFPDIKPDPSGKGVESPARAVRGLKKLDVRASRSKCQESSEDNRLLLVLAGELPSLSSR